LGVLWFINPRVGQSLWINTLFLAAGACALAVPVGTLAALLIVKTNAPLRGAAAMLLGGMLLMPLFLIAGAWDAGFGIQGWHTLIKNPHLAHEPWLAGWRAAVWIHGLAAVPWVALIVAAGLRAVEAELEEAATLSASPARVLWHISLPRAAPAIAVAALWVAIVVSVEISVTDFFQVRTFAEEVYTQAALGAFDFSAGSGAGPRPFELSPTGLWLGLAISTLLAGAALVGARRLLAEATHSPHRPTWHWKLAGGRWLAALALVLLLLLVVGVPLANLLYKAGAHVVETESGRLRSWSAARVATQLVAAAREFRGDLALSCALGVAAASAAVLAGLPLAWSLCQARRTPLVRFLGLALCLTIPGPLIGIATIRLLNQPPDSLLSFVAPLYDSHFPTWLVQTIRALPLVTLILWAALASIPQSTLDAAVLDGAGWWRRLLRIALPQRWPAVAAAWLVGMAIAIGELAATVLVVPPGRSTAITVRIFQLLHYGVDDRVAAISLLLGAMAAVLSMAGAHLMSRRVI
jgi:iron(III) transport system permease protein